MDSLVYKINLDCLRKDSQAIVNAKVGETNGRKIVFTLYEGRSAFFVPEGATAIFRAKKPSGAVLYNSCVINDGKVEYTLTQQTVAEQGVFPCEIQIVGADKKIIYTPCITLDVAQNLYSDAEVESTSEFTALTGAIDEVRASKAFTIKLTTTNGGITADKTFTEIAEKVNAAKSVVINMDGWVFPVSYSADSGKIVFSSLWANIAEIPNTVTFAVNSSNAWNVVVSDIPTTAQVSAKYTKPVNGIPKDDLASDVQASLDKAENAVEYFEVTLTAQDGVLAADKTYAQVKAEVENGKRFLAISGISSFYILVKVTENAISFVSSDYRGVNYELVTVQQGDIWNVETVIAENTKNITEIYSNIGVLANLTTADKSSLVAAVNEVKQASDGKQDKLIAGENITISADGKTISATGGSSVPKPLTYDYMPEGYPKKSVQTTTLMEEQEVEFVFTNDLGVYWTHIQQSPLAIAEGKTYTVNWDGTEYECVCFVFNSIPAIGNLSILGVGDDTGEPFAYEPDENAFITLNPSPTHTISVKTTEETVTPMSAEFIPTMNVSAFTNDAGYLTLATLPKYGGESV